MNKTLKLFMVAAVAAISIVSCKKGTTEEPVVEPTCNLTKLESIIDGVPEGSSILTYDDTNRMKTVTEGNLVSTLTYGSNEITISSPNEALVMTLTSGKISKTGSNNGSSYKTFAYNTEGYLVKVMNYSGTTLEATTTLTYTDGNLTKFVNDMGSAVKTTINEYSSELFNANLFQNNALSDATDDFILGKYFGKQSKNLRTKSTVTYLDSQSGYTYKEVTTFVYTKNASGQYDSGTITTVETPYIGASKTSIQKDNYTYTCK